MEFGWINLFGAGIIVLIMIPNIIYAAGQKQDETQIEVPRGLSACEQVGSVIICPGCSTREKRPYQ